MSTRAAASALSQIARELSAVWEDTKLHWRDAKAAEFQREYLDALPPLVARSVEAMEDLDKCLRQIRNECE